MKLGNKKEHTKYTNLIHRAKMKIFFHVGIRIFKTSYFSEQVVQDHIIKKKLQKMFNLIKEEL